MKILLFRRLFLLAFFLSFFCYRPELFADTKCGEAFSPESKESHYMFAKNFKDGNLKGDNAYFVVDYGLSIRLSGKSLEGTPFIGRVIDPAFAPNKMLVEKIELASGRKQTAILHYKMGKYSNFYETSSQYRIEHQSKSEKKEEVLSFTGESSGPIFLSSIIKAGKQLNFNKSIGSKEDQELLSLIGKPGSLLFLANSRSLWYDTIIDIINNDVTLRPYYTRNFDEEKSYLINKNVQPNGKFDRAKSDITRGAFAVLMYQGHPQLSALFNARKSNKKRLTIEELKLPELENTEEKLSALEYSPLFTKGLNELNQWIALKEQFIKHKVNPYVTHIDYFARKIPKHIAHIREGIKPNMQGMSERINILKHLEQVANKATQNKQVTYNWWITFNWFLVKTLSPSYENIKSELKQYLKGDLEPPYRHQKIINLFPLKVLLPTIKELGLMFFNRTIPFDIHPLALVNKVTKVDKLDRNPLDFFNHDFGHADINHTHHPSQNDILIHKQFMQKIENLPRETREHLEIIYFDMTHEGELNTIQTFINMSSPTKRRLIKRALREFSDYGNIATILKHPEKSESHINKLISYF